MKRVTTSVDHGSLARGFAQLYIGAVIDVLGEFRSANRLSPPIRCR